jgi:4-aminobutyrate aminotransferase-like enzyme/GNAT superfamily N-acetyltransferase
MNVTLSATWNKTKREPFEIPGFDTIYTEHPSILNHNIKLDTPKNWLEAWDSSTNQAVSMNSDGDEQLTAEVKSLNEVRKHLESQSVFAIIIEPMQCEGGDRYSSSRFHQALLAMARSFQVPVIYDEVQTGFHLGTDFFWHRQFELKDLAPDYITCAKKAQTGLVLSKRSINRKEDINVSSLIRGYYHALYLDQLSNKINEINQKAMQRLESFVSKYKDHIENPRGLGQCFAFDFKNKDQIALFIKNRFQVGLLFYPAGERTLRFRLNTAFRDQDLDFLFNSLELLADHIFLNKDLVSVEQTPASIKCNEDLYEWHQTILEIRKNRLFNDASSDELVKNLHKKFGPYSITRVDGTNFKKYEESIVKIEEIVYEPTRRTEIEKFEKAANHENGICYAVEDKDRLIAIIFSAPLELFPLERGIRRDQHFTDPKSLYMLDSTVLPDYQGKSIGRNLKYLLTAQAISQGMNYIQGRNRDRLASGMLNINLSLGSVEHIYIEEDYPDFEQFRDVIYYSSKLQWEHEELNLSSAIENPLGEELLKDDFMGSHLAQSVNKICLSNFVNENFLMHVKNLSELAPKSLRHMYTASGQSECVDKIFKSIWYHQKQSNPKSYKCLSLEGHYFGESSFMSAGLSGMTNFFPIDVVATKDKSEQDIIKDLKDKLSTGEYFTLWLEPIAQRTMTVLSQSFLKEVKKLCSDHQCYLVYNETSSSRYNYSEKNFYVSSDPELMPDAFFNFLGGQAGICHIKTDLFISKPLMMISTWDGDEISFARYDAFVDWLGKNKKEYFDLKSSTIDWFKELSKNNKFEVHFAHGVGYLKGVIPYDLQKKLTGTAPQHYIIDPSISSMKRISKRN